MRLVAPSYIVVSARSRLQSGKPLFDHGSRSKVVYGCSIRIAQADLIPESLHADMTADKLQALHAIR